MGILHVAVVGPLSRSLKPEPIGSEQGAREGSMTLPTVLCVDDEPNVLHGLRRALRGSFDVYTAESGDEALRLLATGIDVAVICSDMRMPGMDGAQLLARCRTAAPDATRVLLSGQADIASLERVINGGGIFRFLVKPIERVDLVAALQEAAEHHRLIRAEKELLEGTVVGSLKLLTEALSMASPEAFGRGQRVEELVRRMAAVEGVELGWEERTAASVACLGMLSVPPSVRYAVECGASKDPKDIAMVDGIPAAGAELLDNIPRLQRVAAILRRVGKGSAWIEESIDAALRFAGQAHGETSAEQALQRIRNQLSPRCLKTLWAIHTQDTDVVAEVRANQLAEGMQLMEPVRTRTGVLLMPAGVTLTPSALTRLKNFGMRYGLEEPLRVRLPPPEVLEGVGDDVAVAS
jgi:CheY-like chemotaxis protein